MTPVQREILIRKSRALRARAIVHDDSLEGRVEFFARAARKQPTRARMALAVTRRRAELGLDMGA